MNEITESKQNAVRSTEKILLSDGAKYVIDALEAAGYRAYAVGGCVRDALLGSGSERLRCRCIPHCHTRCAEFFCSRYGHSHRNKARHRYRSCARRADRGNDLSHRRKLHRPQKTGFGSFLPYARRGSFAPRYHDRGNSIFRERGRHRPIRRTAGYRAQSHPLCRRPACATLRERMH